MFKKLRNKLLLVNLITITVLMLTSIIIIFSITTGKIYSEARLQLSRVIRIGAPIDLPLTRNNMIGSQFSAPLGPVSEQLFNHRERYLSFSVFLDTNGTIEELAAPFGINKEIYDELVSNALQKNKETSKIYVGTKNPTVWMYNITTLLDGKALTFIDFTSSQRTIDNLIKVCLLAFFITLICVFFLSLYFANKAINPVKDAFAVQRQFVQDASHEIRTPLTVINTNLDLVISNSEESVSSQLKWLEYIKGETQRLSRLTEDLLYLAKADQGHSNQIHFSPVDLGGLTKDVLIGVEALIYEHDQTLVSNICENVIVLGSKEELKQVVMILVDNAVCYTPKGNNIEVSVTTNDGFAELVVKNHGIGISNENIAKVFDRFFRADESRKRNSSGQGLGLSIAKTIVEKHKGHIRVTSHENEYTQFTVILGLFKK